MSNFIKLLAGAGARQRLLLLELQSQAVICLNRDTGFWERGGLASKYAKNLLLKSDKTIDEQIKNIEPFILRNEADAKRLNVKLSGYGRSKLNNLYQIKQNIYG